MNKTQLKKQLELHLYDMYGLKGINGAYVKTTNLRFTNQTLKFNLKIGNTDEYETYNDIEIPLSLLQGVC